MQAVNDVLMMKQVASEVGITNSALSRYIRLGVISLSILQHADGRRKIIRAADIDTVIQAINDYRFRSRKYRLDTWRTVRQQSAGQGSDHAA